MIMYGCNSNSDLTVETKNKKQIVNGSKATETENSIKPDNIYSSELENFNYKINDKSNLDLIEQPIKFHKNGKKKYLKYFNSTNVAKFIINKSLDIKSKNKYIWEK